MDLTVPLTRVMAQTVLQVLLEKSTSSLGDKVRSVASYKGLCDKVSRARVTFWIF